MNMRQNGPTATYFKHKINLYMPEVLDIIETKMEDECMSHNEMAK